MNLAWICLLRWGKGMDRTVSKGKLLAETGRGRGILEHRLCKGSLRAQLVYGVWRQLSFSKLKAKQNKTKSRDNWVCRTGWGFQQRKCPTFSSQLSVSGGCTFHPAAYPMGEALCNRKFVGNPGRCCGYLVLVVPHGIALPSQEASHKQSSPRGWGAGHGMRKARARPTPAIPTPVESGKNSGLPLQVGWDWSLFMWISKGGLLHWSLRCLQRADGPTPSTDCHFWWKQNKREQPGHCGKWLLIPLGTEVESRQALPHLPGAWWKEDS